MENTETLEHLVVIIILQVLRRNKNIGLGNIELRIEVLTLLGDWWYLWLLHCVNWTAQQFDVHTWRKAPAGFSANK